MVQVGAPEEAPGIGTRDPGQVGAHQVGTHGPGRSS